MEIGPEKVRICFKKWSGFGPILENIGPFQDLGALHHVVLGHSKISTKADKFIESLLVLQILQKKAPGVWWLHMCPLNISNF